MPIRGLLAGATLALYPVWSFGATSAGRPELSLAGLAVLIVLASSLRADGWPRNPLLWLVVTAFVVAAAFDAISAWPLGLYLPPVLVPAGLAVVFGRSLRPGRRPLIVAFMQQVMGDVTPAKARYGRALTVMWTGILIALAVEALLLGIFSDHATWSLMTNVVNYAIVATVFLVELSLGWWLFGPPPQPRRLLTVLLQADWRRLGTSPREF